MAREYYLDPGADTLRLLDKKARIIKTIRSCQSGDDPSRTGQEALKAFWNEGKNPVFPFSQGVVKEDALSLLEALVSPEQYDHLLPGQLTILTPRLLDESQQKFWQQAALRLGFSQAEFCDPFQWNRKGARLWVHAGASWTIATAYLDGKPVARRFFNEGGLSLDGQITTWIARKFRGLIFAEDARIIKEKASELIARGQEGMLSCTVLDQRKGFVTVTFAASELAPLFKEAARTLARKVSRFVAKLEPDFQKMLEENPIRLSGGMAQCAGIRDELACALALPVLVESEPSLALVRGFARENTEVFPI